ncbi:MAG TPA: polysaccharide biosynthesis/export family protein [bacterium]|nr:polysaccharide export protein [Chlamydiota bacterium]HOE27704.1 polysaccharide biosynthesis/export family protein [bacterium]
MRARLVSLIICTGVLCSAMCLGQTPGEQAARRNELEQKYPDIKFNWPKTPGAGEAEGGEAVPVDPSVSTPDLEETASTALYQDASEIAQEEVLMRQKQRRAYMLGPGDVISINVRDHPEFSSYGVRVGYAGEVILPLTNEVVYAEGLTVEEVRLAIEEKLKAYIERPFVSVFITEFNSKKFYVLGEIGAGIYPIGATNISLMEAMYAAGLPSEGIAAMRRVQIITPHETDPINRWVNVYAILYKGRMEHNITIEPGTIIYVPTTIFTKFSRVIRQVSVTIEDLSKIPNDLASFDSGLIAWDTSWNMNIFPKGIDLHGGNKASRWYDGD